jgi:hypothetical protein
VSKRCYTPAVARHTGARQLRQASAPPQAVHGAKDDEELASNRRIRLIRDAPKRLFEFFRPASERTLQKFLLQRAELSSGYAHMDATVDAGNRIAKYRLLATFGEDGSIALQGVYLLEFIPIKL